MKKSKAYGIVGGMGAHASAVLFQKIMDGVENVESDVDYPNMWISNVGVSNFGVSAVLTVEAKAELSNTVQKLKHVGCEKVWVACSSVHGQKEGWWDESLCVDWPVEFGQSFLSDSVVLCSESARLLAVYPQGVSVVESFQAKINDCIDAVIRGMHVYQREEASRKWSILLEEAKGRPVAFACTELSVLAHAFGAPKESQDALDFIAKQVIGAWRSEK